MIIMLGVFPVTGKQQQKKRSDETQTLRAGQLEKTV